MKKYLKGQLHLHTTKSDGTGSPNMVAQGYREKGYDFIVITDHGTNYNPYDLIEKRDDFLCIPGAEWDSGNWVNSQYLGKGVQIHLNALCYLGDFNQYKNVNCSVSDNINAFLKEIYRVGAIPTVNHPNWNMPDPFAFDYRDLMEIDYPYILEVKNCCVDNYSEGNLVIESMEYTWDVLLTAGKKVLCTFDDDAHHYAVEVRKLTDMFHVPFQSAVMVYAELTENCIKEALQKGDFYATTGIEFEKYEVSDKGIYVKIKDQGISKSKFNHDMVYNIVFKGRMGRPLAWFTGLEGEYIFKHIPDEEYVRVKAYNTNYDCAMTQPIFQDGHKIILSL
ncbi:MAG: PHP domain-containing protein [Abditibacteriota bacterium]|nr:PHP domain-containing protein [Abditibacteriota bacterium]